MRTSKKIGRPVNPQSKLQRGIDRHTQPRKSFHAPKELFDSLSRFIESQSLRPAESEVLRAALAEYLAARGFWEGE